MLTQEETRALLESLCLQLGFCLPPETNTRLASDPPTDPDAFAEAVFAAEGLPIHEGGKRLYKQVRNLIADAMTASDDQASNSAMHPDGGSAAAGDRPNR